MEFYKLQGTGAFTSLSRSGSTESLIKLQEFLNPAVVQFDKPSSFPFKVPAAVHRDDVVGQMNVEIAKDIHLEEQTKFNGDVEGKTHDIPVKLLAVKHVRLLWSDSAGQRRCRVCARFFHWRLWVTYIVIQNSGSDGSLSCMMKVIVQYKVTSLPLHAEHGGWTAAMVSSVRIELTQHIIYSSCVFVEVVFNFHIHLPRSSESDADFPKHCLDDWKHRFYVPTNAGDSSSEVWGSGSGAWGGSRSSCDGHTVTCRSSIT